jgi:TolB-like protein/class 3 adenylate cyclase
MDVAEDQPSPVPPARAERKLAAILAADIAGYSRLMGVDEEGTLARIKTIRAELIEPKVGEHCGRIVQTAGDGILIEFPSVVEAVCCAVEMQQGLTAYNVGLPEEKRIAYRVGINLCDIIVEGSEIHGDGVNVAARLQGLAEPGGVFISRTVRDEVRDKVPFCFEDLGQQAVKNIARPLRVFRVSWDVPGGPAGQAATQAARPALSLPDKPSIAVLPFQNMSGDPEQEYFADGMVEDIITALSRMRWLFVIARNSSFNYKGRAVDVKRVARELGVRYVLEGSVRKETSRVRIAGQLIDGSTGAHLWADRFEGALEDIFDLQDQMTASVVGAIAPRLEQAEIERAKRKPTERLDAYDYYLRAMASHYLVTWENTNEALGMFYRAIELDPGFASAHGMAALCYCWRKSSSWMANREQEIAETARLARRAVELGRDDAAVLAASGYALAYVVQELDDGAAFIDRAVALNPNLAVAWYYNSWARIWLGEPDPAIEHLARAMRLSPLDPLIGWMQATTAHAHFFAGRYDVASSWAGMALRDRPDYIIALRIAAASNALAGQQEQARKALSRLRQLAPTLRVSNLKDTLGPYRRQADVARYETGLEKAGLPA